MSQEMITPFGQFDPLLNPPFTLNNARAISVGLRCNDGALEQIVKTTFSWAAPEVTVTHDVIRKKTPFSPQIDALAVFTDFCKPSSGSDKDSIYPYKEMAVFIKVSYTHKGKEHSALHMPYVYLDFVPALITGRELYGMPKKPGILEIPEHKLLHGTPPLKVFVRAAEETGSEWKEHELCSIEGATGGVGAEPEEEDQNIHLSLFKLPLIQLKQFPSTNAQSLYRAVTLTDAQFQPGLHFPPIPHNKEIHVKIKKLKTDPMHDVFSSGKYNSSISSFTTSFELKTSRVLHQVGTCLEGKPA